MHAMVSSWFLPRDAVCKRGTSWRLSVHLSVCLSVSHTGVLYPNG